MEEQRPEQYFDQCCEPDNPWAEPCFCDQEKESEDCKPEGGPSRKASAQLQQPLEGLYPEEPASRRPEASSKGSEHRQNVDSAPAQRSSRFKRVSSLRIRNELQNLFEGRSPQELNREYVECYVNKPGNFLQHKVDTAFSKISNNEAWKIFCSQSPFATVITARWCQAFVFAVGVLFSFLGVAELYMRESKYVAKYEEYQFEVLAVRSGGTLSSLSNSTLYPGLKEFGLLHKGCPFAEDSAVSRVDQTVTVRFPEPVSVDGFYMVTSNEDPDLDPVHFKLRGKSLGSDFETLAESAQCLKAFKSSPFPLPWAREEAVLIEWFSLFCVLPHHIAGASAFFTAGALAWGTFACAIQGKGRLGTLVLSYGWIIVLLVELMAAIVLHINGRWQESLHRFARLSTYFIWPLSMVYAEAWAVELCFAQSFCLIWLAYWEWNAFNSDRLPMAVLQAIGTVGICVILMYYRERIRIRARRGVQEMKQRFDDAWEEIMFDQIGLTRIGYLSSVIAMSVDGEGDSQSAAEAIQMQGSLVQGQYLFYLKDSPNFSRYLLGLTQDNQVSSLDTLYAQARALQPHFVKKVCSWALETHGHFQRLKDKHNSEALISWRQAVDEGIERHVVFTALKDQTRAIEKLSRSYVLQVSKLLDVVRETVVFACLDDLSKCLSAIYRDKDVEIIRITNRLSEEYDGWETAGFRDVKLNLKIKTSQTQALGLDGHVTELQLITASFFFLKQPDEHQRWIEFRNTRCLTCRKMRQMKKKIGRYFEQLLGLQSRIAYDSSFSRGHSVHSRPDEVFDVLARTHTASSTQQLLSRAAQPSPIGLSRVPSEVDYTGVRARSASATQQMIYPGTTASPLGFAPSDDSGGTDSQETESTVVDILGDNPGVRVVDSMVGSPNGSLRVAQKKKLMPVLNHGEIITQSAHLSAHLTSVSGYAEMSSNPPSSEETPAHTPKLHKDIFLGSSNLHVPARQQTSDTSCQSSMIPGTTDDTIVQHAIQRVLLQKYCWPGNALDMMVGQFRHAFKLARSESVFFTAWPVSAALSKPVIQAMLILLAIFMSLETIFKFLPAVHGYTYSAKHFRFSILRARDGTPAAKMLQPHVSGFGVLKCGCPQPVGWNVTNLQFEANSNISVDGLHQRSEFDVSSTSIVQSFPEETEMNGWFFVTASDSPERDPVSFKVEMSKDGLEWTEVSHNLCTAPMLAMSQPPPECFSGRDVFETSTERELRHSFDLRLPWFLLITDSLFYIPVTVGGTLGVLCGCMGKPRAGTVTFSWGWEITAYLQIIGAFGAVFAGSGRDAAVTLLYGLLNVVFAKILATETHFPRWLPFHLLFLFLIEFVFHSVVRGRPSASVTEAPRLGWLVLSVGTLLLLLARSTVLYRSRKKIRVDKQKYDEEWMVLNSTDQGVANLEELDVVAGTMAPRGQDPRQCVHGRSGAGRVAALLLKHHEVPSRTRQSEDSVYVCSLDQLYSIAVVVQRILRSKAQDWASGSDGHFKLWRPDDGSHYILWDSIKNDSAGQKRVKWAGLKKVDRAIEKLARSYHNDPSRLLDVCRECIIFDGVPELSRCLEMISHDREVEVLRVKNRLSSAYSSWDTCGYRDVMLNFRIVTERTLSLGLEGHVCEVQLVTKAFMDLRTEEGHSRYVAFRNQIAR